MDNNYSHPDIPEILNQEGNSVCVDCGSEKPKWASMNNGVFLCLKCAGIHRGFGMSVSLIRSLQIDSWTEKQLLYLTKGGNKNFKNNLSEFNIAETAALDIKYKSKAADYYRKYLKNEVDREGDPNYVPTQIVKPDIEVAMDIIDIKEETEEKKEKPEEKDKQIKKKFFGFMNNILTKVKEGTSGAAKKVGKGISDLKIGDKLKVAGTAIAGAAKTSGHFIADTTTKAVHKTKEGMDILSEKTKQVFRKGSKEIENNPDKKQGEEGKQTGEENKKEENGDNTKAEEKKGEDKKEEEKKEEEKKEENKEEEKKEEKKEENKEEEKKNLGNSEVPEQKVDAGKEEKSESAPAGQA